MSIITPLDIYLPEVKVFLNLDSYSFSSFVLCIFNIIFIQPLLPFHKGTFPSLLPKRSTFSSDTNSQVILF